MDPDKSCYVRCSAVDTADGTLISCFVLFICIIVMSYDEILHRITLYNVYFSLTYSIICCHHEIQCR